MQMADKIVLRSVAADPPYLVDDKGGDPSSDAKRSWTSCWSHGSRRGPSRGGSCSSRANPEIRCSAIVPPSVDEWLPGAASGAVCGAGGRKFSPAIERSRPDFFGFATQ